MRRYTLLIFLIIALNFAKGQNTFKKNDIYIEAGGNALFGSVNYERQLTTQPGLGVRIGLGFYTENAFYISIPVGINYLFQLKNPKSFIDAGLGLTWTKSDFYLIGSTYPYTGDYFINFIPSLGFRRHTSKNVMWRVNLTPVANKYSFTPWIGASIGKRF